MTRESMAVVLPALTAVTSVDLLVADNALGFAGIRLFDHVAMSLLVGLSVVSSIVCCLFAPRHTDHARFLLAISLVVFLGVRFGLPSLPVGAVPSLLLQVATPLGLLVAGLLCRGRATGGGGRLVATVSAVLTSCWFILLFVPGGLVWLIWTQTAAFSAAVAWTALPVLRPLASWFRMVWASADVR